MWKYWWLVSQRRQFHQVWVSNHSTAGQGIRIFPLTDRGCEGWSPCHSLRPNISRLVGEPPASEPEGGASHPSGHECDQKHACSFFSNINEDSVQIIHLHHVPKTEIHIGKSLVWHIHDRWERFYPVLNPAGKLFPVLTTWSRAQEGILKKRKNEKTKNAGSLGVV